MSNKQYMDFFDACLNNQMIIKKYEPVKEYLFRIIRFYSTDAAFKYGSFSSDKTICYSKVCFVQNLLSLFTDIMKEKKYQDLHDILTLLFELTYSHDTFLSLFEMIMFQDKCNSFYSYAIKMGSLCDKYVSNITNMKVFTKTKLEQFLRVYTDYYITQDAFKGHPFIYLEHTELGCVLLAYCYLYDYSIESMKEIFNSVIDNYSEFYDYINNNELDVEYDFSFGDERIKLVKSLIDRIKNKNVNKKQIK